MIFFVLLFLGHAYAQEFQDPGPIRSSLSSDFYQLRTMTPILNVRMDESAADVGGDARALRALMTRDEIKQTVDPRTLDTHESKHRPASSEDLERLNVPDECSGQWMIREQGEEKAKHTSLYCNVDDKIEGTAYQFRNGKTLRVKFAGDQAQSVEEINPKFSTDEPQTVFNFGETYRGYVMVEQTSSNCKSTDANRVEFKEENGEMMVVLSEPGQPPEKHSFAEIEASMKEEDRLIDEGVALQKQSTDVASKVKKIPVTDKKKKAERDRLKKQRDQLIERQRDLNQKRQNLLHKRLMAARALVPHDDGYTESLKELRWRKADKANAGCSSPREWKQAESNTGVGKIVNRACFNKDKLDGPATENELDESEREVRRMSQLWKDDSLVEEVQYLAGDSSAAQRATLVRANYRGFNLYNTENGLCRGPQTKKISFSRNANGDLVMEQSVTKGDTGQVQRKTELVDKLIPKLTPKAPSPKVPGSNQLPPRKPQQGSI